MKIFIYIRPNSKDFLTNLARKMDSNCTIMTWCDFKGYGDVWAGQYLKKNSKEVSDIDLDILDNIRLRCRFLRNIKRENAYDLIRKYYYGVSKAINEFKPDLILAQMPDNYCMDVIQRVAISKSIVVINMLELFIGGYSRITLRGERTDIRDVSVEEAEEVVTRLLKKSYVANYDRDRGESYREHMRFLVRRKLIENLYYPLRKIIDGDRWNYHYNTIYYRGVPFNHVISKNMDRYFTHIDDVDVSKYSIYVPLHCYPESTVDYYGDLPEYALYEELMLRFISEADPEVQFLIKEHPAMYGARIIDFYEKMRKFPNVVLIHPYDDSNHVLEKVKYLLIFSGSVGVEALLRQKVLFSITSNYYSDINPNVHLVKRVKKELFDIDYIPYDNVKFMQDVLAGAIPALHAPQKELMKSDIDTMAEYMRKYYLSKPTQKLN